MQKNFYPPEWFAELKQKNDIVTTVSRYLTLKRKGRTLWACCPFHHEKTPSFAVNEENQFYHCFGCGESGDAITFVAKMENCTNHKAIEILAEKVGMKMPENLANSSLVEKQKKERDRSILALNLAKEFYKQNLYKPEAKIAQDYLKKRLFKKSDLDNFEIGYSNRNTVVKYLLSKNFNEEEIVKAGIAGKFEDRIFDVISDRLVFPIINSFGDCVGFSGRTLKAEDKAKYKNTAQTSVFDKSSCVYGIHLFKKIKKEKIINQIVIVEGQIDVIKMNSAGVTPTVACLGTALTSKHAKELKRYANKVILCFDGDEAGQKATLRAIPILIENELEVKVVRLPNGKDPDEMLKLFGKEKMQELIDNAKPYVEYLLNVKKEKYNLKLSDEKSKYIKEALQIISKLNTASEQEIYINSLSEATGVAVGTLKKDLSLTDKNVAQSEDVDVLTLKEDGNIKAVKYVLLAILNKEPYALDNLAILKYIINPVYNSIYKKLINNEKDFTSEEETIVNSLNDLDANLLNEKFYKECEFKIFEDVLKTKQIVLNEKYKECSDLEERKNISKEILEIIKKLKSKQIN